MLQTVVSLEIVIYDCGMLTEEAIDEVLEFIVQATVATIINYNCNTFIVQATRIFKPKAFNIKLYAAIF
jgi:hypothetical protein